MNAIPVGAKGSFSMIVAPEHLASRFKDPSLPPVLATPVMILFMENAALAAIRAYLPAGESALGTVIDIRHLAATPVGQQVTAEAVVTGVASTGGRVGSLKRLARCSGTTTIEKLPLAPTGIAFMDTTPGSRLRRVRRNHA